jgi:hypothetical protein
VCYRAPIDEPDDAMEDRVRHLIHYDAERRRLWLLGQRCHHGATGVLLTFVGAALMAHDWKDRPLWFQRGWQRQP